MEYKSIAMMRNIFLITILSLLPNVLAECTCEPEDEDRDKSLALKYKMVAFVSIFVAGIFGVCLPMAGRCFPVLSPERNLFFVVKAFAAGVILATGFIHILPEAFERLSSPCISEKPWGEFPFTGFIAMVAAIGTLMVDTYATSYYQRRSTARVGGGADQETAAPLHTHATHGHAHGSISGGGETDVLRHRVISQVLELGIIVHSVIIGIALGASESPKTIKPLIAALSFHQLFEGMGLGGCITQAKFNTWTSAIMVFFFSITTPVGIAIGIGISNVYDESSPTALIVEGVFDSAAAGILVYMALVDLLSADFMSPKLQNNGKLMLWANVALLLGAGCMSLLAKWA